MKYSFAYDRYYTKNKNKFQDIKKKMDKIVMNNNANMIEK
jgi:hypothetical protein